MKVDTSKIAPGGELQADVCIVGGGAAGITLAHDLIASGLDVVLLEGGGYTASAESQALYAGAMSGGDFPRQPQYLSTSRLRFFGGTTNHWAGWCRPIHADVFEGRPWVPDAAWPISRTTLDPWYRRAAPVLEIPPFPADAAAARDPRAVDLGEHASFETRLFHYSPPTRFGQRYRSALERADNVRVLLDANVVKFDLHEGARAIRRVHVRRLDGRSWTVSARCFVLAAGGIENARLLLQSDHQLSAGVGNSSGLVGRYFADHPEIGFGRHCQVTLSSAAARDRGFWSLYGRPRPDTSRGGGKTRGVFWLTPDAMRAHSIMHFHVQVYRVSDTELDETGEAVDGLARHWLGADEARPKARATDGRTRGSRIFVRAEPAPNRNNRVELTRERDAIGIRRLALRCQLGDLDRRTHQKGFELFARDFARHGRVRAPEDMLGDRPFKGVAGGMHHMGTTRMHGDPKRGVVDADCRSHDHDNLYLAGSSVFPSAGGANPTYTIVALALRLSETIQRRLAAGAR